MSRLNFSAVDNVNTSVNVMGSVMTNVLDRCESLLRAKNLDELYRDTREIAHELGFEEFLHGMRVSVSLYEPAQFVLRGSQAAWQAHYQAQGYDRVDPVISHCARHSVPITWDDQLFAKPQAAKLYRDARDFGLISGVTFPIHGPGVDVALLSLVSTRPLGQKLPDLAILFAQGHLFACYLHEAIRNLALDEAQDSAKSKTLTDREKQCLLWAAVGKTSWEIAKILNISERTTVFHFTNAASKLGAVNRRQAVVRAIALGYINP
jgi:DNA-binding CsgD family transcriptional regulator